jgi:hypothetical protein
MMKRKKQNHRCNHQPSFGRPGETATHCKTHKTDDMEGKLNEKLKAKENEEEEGNQRKSKRARTMKRGIT